MYKIQSIRKIFSGCALPKKPVIFDYFLIFIIIDNLRITLYKTFYPVISGNF